jgi:hypothetical protein
VTFSIKSVSWEDPAGEALRAAMRAEMRERYVDRLPPGRDEPQMVVTGEGVVGVGLAVTGDTTAIGHALLRRHGYRPIPVYEPYLGMPGAHGFAKTPKSKSVSGTP